LLFTVGQYVWIRRAASAQDENDVIVELKSTIGRIREANNPIGVPPPNGIGWIRVSGPYSRPGNFGAGLLSPCDSCLWYRPAKVSRTVSSSAAAEAYSASGGVMTSETRRWKLRKAVRAAIRHYVPVKEISSARWAAFATLQMVKAPSASSQSSPQTLKSTFGGAATGVPNEVEIASHSEKLFDYTALYQTQFERHMFYKGRGLTKDQFSKLLFQVGACIDSADLPVIFYSFDFNISDTITLTEFNKSVMLNSYELDDHVEVNPTNTFLIPY